MKMILTSLLVLLSTTIFAKDSTWQLCQGETVLFAEKTKLVVNVYEHRNGAGGRETDLTFIYGGHTLTGSFDSTDSDVGIVELKNEKLSTFEGVVQVDYQDSSVDLAGILTLGEAATKMHADLKCKTLAN